MLPMINKYNIKCMYKFQGKSLRAIARETGHTFATVKKYAEMEDFNERPKERMIKSKLDPFKELIIQWLIDDLKAPPKQKHTSRRIYNRLSADYPDTFNISYRTLCEYVFKEKKKIAASNAENTTGMVLLQHSPGEAQLDFGSVSFYLKDKKIEGYHLVLSFPYSNKSYTQIFPAQNQEALFEGMRNIFEYIGAVPKEIWFDNMSTAVTQVKKAGKRVLTDTFYKFTAHYGYEAKFCNPASGNEKGHVENKVGYVRRNFMVPLPRIESIEEFNKELLKLCDDDSSRLHYTKGISIKNLFLDDLKSMYHLNKNRFEVFKMFKAKTNKLGYVNFQNNLYSVLPDALNEEVWIKAYVDVIEILNENYELLSTHLRTYEKNSKVTNWKDWIPVLAKKIRAFEYTELYNELPSVWTNFFKSKTLVEDKRKIVSALGEILASGSIAVATEALEENLNKGITDTASLLVTFRAKLEPNKKFEEFALEEHIPKQLEYEIEFSEYDRFLGGI